MTNQPRQSFLSSSAMPGVVERHRGEERFRRLGLAAIAVSMSFLAFFLISIIGTGYGAFIQTAIKIDVDLTLPEIGLEEGFTSEDLAKVRYRSVVRAGMRALVPEDLGRRESRTLYGLMGAGAEFELRDKVLAQPDVVGSVASFWLTSSDDVDLYNKAGSTEASEQQTRLTAKQIEWYSELKASDRIKTRFNWTFLTGADSRDPEVAGVWGAIVGSFFALGVCLLLSCFVGVLAAIYLEEFAARNRWTQFLEVNINNLAAVPSITFGLLGLAIFLGFFGLPRSASLVGGMVLALMTLPTVIISSRVALQAVAPSIREAAFGIGAIRVQTVFHHVVPLAMPGILTGIIIGMARALGETAPLLMIGMVAFIADAPTGLTQPASALPVQVYLWADSPERAFAEKTAGAILVLLVFLLLMNLMAVILRRKFEK
jgi:phosphate transport system permease protein